MSTTASRLLFGGLELPADIATQHFAILGTTGSGKTLTLRMLLKHVLPEIGQGLDCRAVVYDPKRNFAPILAGMGVAERLVFLNPFDARCTPWDVAQDIRSSADIHQFAATLIPNRSQGSNQYFYDTARLILGGVLRSVINRLRDQWILRHVLLIVRHPHDVIRTLSIDPQTVYLVNQFSETKSLPEVLSTIASKLGQFEPIAAAWATAGNTGISLDRWISEESILLLGQQRKHREALRLLYQLLMARISAAVLDDAKLGERRPTRKTWLVFDELATAPKIEDLNELMLLGREYGLCCVLGFQCSPALRSLYGADIAKTIMAQCHNRAVLGFTDEDSASEAARDFGTVNQGGKQVQLLESSKLLNLPPCDTVNGLHGFYKTALRIAYHSHLKPEELRRLLPKADKSIDAWQPRDERDFELPPWRPEERAKFGLLPELTANPLDQEPRGRSSIWDLPN